MFSLDEINCRAKSDPAEFCTECEQQYMDKVVSAADRIIANMQRSPLVFLSGPSSSGKTTTAKKICGVLEARGVGTHYVSMDDYFHDVGETTPLTEEGEYDFESPLCLDAKLLDEHFSAISEGREIQLPKFDFHVRTRSPEPGKTIRLGKDEICIFEGIHALNPYVCGNFPNAFRLFISTRSDVQKDGETVFLAREFRLIRRTVRDSLFRNTPPEETYSRWASVRRGERLYINPYRGTADFSFDTAMPCELCITGPEAIKLLNGVDLICTVRDETQELAADLTPFEPISTEFVANDSLLREFIGGGVYDY